MNKSWSPKDHKMMSLALQLAKKGQYTARPNPMVGCVIEKKGQIIGQGWHRKYGLAHAEINALHEAGKQALGATCYVTLEPCAHEGKTGPCALALVKAGVAKVIAAMLDPNPEVSGKGFQILIDAGIEVQFGLLEAEASIMNRGFVSRCTRRRPWVTCKLAMSLDGRTALADGTSQWITGSKARADVQKLRARQDAILTGSGTILADNPSLNVRIQSGSKDETSWFNTACELGFSQPIRVLLDREKKVTSDVRIFNDDAEVLWFVDKPDSTVFEEHVSQVTTPASLSDLLTYLAENGINQLLIESGHKLAGNFLKQALIDELIVYMAPKIMGNRGMGLFDVNISKMLDVPVLRLKQLRQIGDDIRLTYEIS